MTAEKKIKGRKRHIGVDVMGNLLGVYVHSATIHDTMSGTQIFKYLYHKYATIEAFCADGGYCGTSVEFVEKTLRLDMQISKKITDHGFKVLPKRWIVERTFAWIGNSRRLSKDFEIKEYSEANMIRISMLKLTLAKVIN